MPKDEWGTKRICPTTGRRFYDLKKTPIVSPYTGETVTLDANTRTRVAVVEKPKKKEEEPVVKEENSDLLDDADDATTELNDDLLDNEDDDNVTLDVIADVASDKKEG